MAESDKDQKTHAPTEHRLEQARKRGDVPMAMEMRHALMMAGAMVVTGWLGIEAIQELGAMSSRLWGSADDFRLDPIGAQALMTGVARYVALALMPIFGVLMLCAVATMFLQGRFMVSWSRVKPKFSKFSPMHGMKRIFGVRSLVEFAKTLAKFSAIALVVLLVLKPRLSGFDQLVGFAPGAIGSAAGQLAYEIVRAVWILLVVLAIFDFFYQRHSYMKRMRMSLQEVKDEHKQNDGDPKIKARIRQIQMQAARKRMMAAVPSASVIITNPTHYSIALKYEHGEMAAPVVVAKGVDEVAMRIREIAKDSQVPIVESPPLARALFASADIDHPIPLEHYAAVAEIIGYVMRLSRRQGAQA